MSEEEKQLINLVNPEFTVSFMGQEYRLRKATMDKAIQYKTKLKELESSEDPLADVKLVIFSLYIMLKDKIPDLTEQIVLENTPADINTVEMLTQLGFISPISSEMVKAMQEKLKQKLNTENSSQ